jgi:hypothetical protein
MCSRNETDRDLWCSEAAKIIARTPTLAEWICPNGAARLRPMSSPQPVSQGDVDRGGDVLMPDVGHPIAQMSVRMRQAHHVGYFACIRENGGGGAQNSRALRGEAPHGKLLKFKWRYVRVAPCLV